MKNKKKLMDNGATSHHIYPDVYLKGFDDGMSFQRKATVNFVKDFIYKYKKMDNDEFRAWMSK